MLVRRARAAAAAAAMLGVALKLGLPPSEPRDLCSCHSRR